MRGSEEPHRAQRAFRSVLDAFARPGVVHEVELAPENSGRPASLDASLEQVARLFVDQAVTFCVVDSETDAVTAYLSGETRARCAPLREADFVVVPVRADARAAHEAVVEACCGTLIAPEKGATVLVGCSRLAEAPESGGVGMAGDRGELGEIAEQAVHVVALRGPGVRDVNSFAVDRVDWLNARAQRGDEFPCGIEIVLVDPDGHVVAVPRSASATLLGDSSPLVHERRSLRRSTLGERAFDAKRSGEPLREEASCFPMDEEVS